MLSGRRDPVGTVTGRAACAVQGLSRGGIERSRCGGAPEALACDGNTMGTGNPAARDGSACAAGSAARARDACAASGLTGGTGGPGPGHHALRVARCTGHGRGHEGSPRVHRSAAQAARIRLNKPLAAFERHHARVEEARHDWLERRVPLMRRQPERLVFLDEPSVKTNLARLRGRPARAAAPDKRILRWLGHAQASSQASRRKASLPLGS